MTIDREVRAIYLDMAQRWEMMARQIEALEAERKQA
jgi:hypothetical protein